MSNVVCFKCQTKIPVLGNVGFRDECFKCKSDVHVCLNCNHHDKTAYNECRETQADVVREKDRSNFCDYFSPSSKLLGEKDAKESLMSAAEALFKKK